MSTRNHNYDVARDETKCQCFITCRVDDNHMRRVCLECNSTGGTLGNVNHTRGCPYYYCSHCEGYASIGKIMFRGYHNTQRNKNEMISTLPHDVSKYLKDREGETIRKIIALKTGREVAMLW